MQTLNSQWKLRRKGSYSFLICWRTDEHRLLPTEIVHLWLALLQNGYIVAIHWTTKKHIIKFTEKMDLGSLCWKSYSQNLQNYGQTLHESHISNKDRNKGDATHGSELAFHQANTAAAERVYSYKGSHNPTWTLQFEDDVGVSHWNVHDKYYNLVRKPRAIQTYHSTGKTSNLNTDIQYYSLPISPPYARWCLTPSSFHLLLLMFTHPGTQAINWDLFSSSHKENISLRVHATDNSSLEIVICGTRHRTWDMYSTTRAASNWNSALSGFSEDLLLLSYHPGVGEMTGL